MTKLQREQFGKQIRAAREKKGLSQKAFGEPLGLTQKAVSRYEMGLGASMEIMDKIAGALGIRYAFLKHEASAPPLTFRELIKMIDGPAFSGYAIARKAGASAQFLTKGDEWNTDITTRIRLFKTKDEADKELQKYKDALIFYIDFALSPIIVPRVIESEGGQYENKD